MQSISLQPLLAEIVHCTIPEVSSQTRLCIAELKKSFSLLVAKTMPSAVLIVSLWTSRLKLHNLQDHSHWYVASQFSSSFWISMERLLAMSVSMSPSIVGVHMPLNIIGTMVSRRVETKTPFRAHLGMQSIKCLWTCPPTKTSSCS